MKVLVVGGAGYIGSHAVRECRRTGIEPVVFDNFSTGNRGAVAGVEVIEGDLLDPRTLTSTFENHKFDAVFHFAASASVPESVARPEMYYHNNVAGSLNLVHAMLEAGVERLVFSSTAATYGDPEEVPIPETHPTRPVNPYGASKLFVERMLADISEKHPLRYIALRYFNAAGADLSGDIGEDHAEESHLIPLVFYTALGKRDIFKIFGNDYETPDGSCIRDFVHVTDIAKAHLLALNVIDQHPNQAINLGSSTGYSVREVIDESQRVVGDLSINVAEAARREGDPPILVASNDRAKSILGWKPQLSELPMILETAWRWHRGNPNGYSSDRGAPAAAQKSTELFGDIAVRLGHVSEEDVARALERQTGEADVGHAHKLLGMHMLELGLLSTSQLIEILKYYENR